jgi:hypothetical protein
LMPLRDYEAHKTYVRERYHKFDKDSEFRNKKKQRDDARRAERMAMLVALKLASGCVDCGYRANADALQFDHVRGTKTNTVTSLAGVKMERLMEEIGKCEVRCANCHAIVTAERRREQSKP